MALLIERCASQGQRGWLELRIYVAPASRHLGVARALVAAVEDWARSMGCSEMASDAAIDDSASHAMHRALGFEETERVLYFRKSLGAAARKD